MFFEDPLLDVVARGLLLGPVALAWIIVTVRVTGLRSFSKMASFDFAVTVATGSLLAMSATAKEWDEFAVRLLAISALLGTQWVIAKTRLFSDGFDAATSNRPIILMRDGKFRDDAMRRSRVTRGDIIAKLREANALQLGEVRAVILETTGDISVLHGEEEVDELLLDSLRR
jgi:uncharacterized membrane protein YcaP (DUF421 family)